MAYIVMAIRYIWHDLNREKKLELGSARNLLTKKATGDVIVVMDDDDLYGEDYIPFMVQQLYSDPRLLLINMKRYLGIQVQTDGGLYSYGLYTHCLVMAFIFMAIRCRVTVQHSSSAATWVRVWALHSSSSGRSDLRRRG